MTHGGVLQKTAVRRFFAQNDNFKVIEIKFRKKSSLSIDIDEQMYYNSIILKLKVRTTKDEHGNLQEK